MNDRPSVHVALFFTAGISLHVWEQLGLLEREVALYRRLQKSGVHITFITYGNSRDLGYASRLGGISILCNRWHLPSSWYRRMIPLLHGSRLSRASLIKTNQTNGASVALRAARLWRKPFIARCGYLWSDFTARRYGPDSMLTRQATKEEWRVYKRADRIVVTTPAMADDIAARIPKSQNRIRIIPNYVETSLFSPDFSQEIRYDLVFTGRLEPQKNLEALLEAIRDLDVSIALIGNGSLAKSLKERFADLGERVQWIGTIPNHELPRYLCAAKLFVLPSCFEGHPKSLIEAMACGLPVIGTDVPGIRDVLRHGETGWLCGTDSHSIRSAIMHLLQHPEVRHSLGSNARRYVTSCFSLERVLEMEMDLYNELCPHEVNIREEV